ncbi:hypothetical protein [Psychroflexus montanilacus]|uniref:hypothetical protein n=1 Tax=Psychroflexus montanilacus TaxID=2873598 RepID=UPI001CCC5C06|nr:hypothetical protein [Psychroflexus montanilacus]MBZ9652239.1 hypothetical protein [Psychroflexus montanilacus]
MKPHLLLLSSILFLISFFNQVNGQTPEEFIDKLKAESASYHDIPLNRYYLSDLDRDGDYEIIERTNRIESAYAGFLNTELNQAFSYDKIYVLKDNEYIQSDKDLGRHLELQLSHYELWRKNILNPVNLTQDSKHLIEENREDFLKEIDFIINQIKEQIE